MEDWQYRVIDERDVLKQKIERLETYLDQCVASVETQVQFSLLHIQLATMCAYATVLDTRIGLFKTE